jgi:glycosyltransferase involved in cell wall biosynthesis
MHLVVEAFSKMPDRKLVVIGTGTQFKRCKAIAGPNVTMLGYQSAAVLLSHMQRARAFIFAAEEDFGITPVEAQACGTPVLAFGRGGAAETVIDGVTGLLFHQQSAEAIRQVVQDFEAIRTRFKPDAIRAHALRFSTARFRNEFRRFVYDRWHEHTQKINVSQSHKASSPSIGFDNVRADDECEGVAI